MTTSLVAFAVTDFRYRTNAANSTLPMRALATQSDYNKTIFPLVEGEKLFKALENYLQVPYVLPKLDQIFFDHTREISATESWGLITIDNGFLFDENVDDKDQEGRKLELLTFIAEEISQQWFGNNVSPNWWSQVWLKEGLSFYYHYIAVDLVRNCIE